MKLELIISEEQLNDMITAMDKAMLFEFCTHKIKKTNSYRKIRDMLILVRKHIIKENQHGKKL